VVVATVRTHCVRRTTASKRCEEDMFRKNRPGLCLLASVTLGTSSVLMAASSAQPPRGMMHSGVSRPLGPVVQDPAPVRFIEQPGALEFTGRLIVRPLSLQERMNRGDQALIAQQADQAARD